MSKITGYFYIFSKLTTSLVLILIIIFMGYALIKSYKGVNDVTMNFDSKYESLSQLVFQNEKFLKEIGSKISQSDKKIIEIRNILKTSKIKNNSVNYQNSIDELLSQNIKLQKKINQIELIFSQQQGLNLEDKNYSENERYKVNSLIKLILLKYKNGESVKNEILYLGDILPNKQLVFEKLNVIQIKKFYGFNNLKNKFNDSVDQYINFYHIKKNKNYALDFIYKFVTVKPNNLKIFANEDLNILMQAKELMDKEDISSSLSVILQIDKDGKFFFNWIEQSKIYIEFMNEIKKVT